MNRVLMIVLLLTVVACGGVAGWVTCSLKASCHMAGYVQRERLIVDGFFEQYRNIEDNGSCDLLHTYMMEARKILPEALTHYDLSENIASEFFGKWNDLLDRRRDLMSK